MKKHEISGDYEKNIRQQKIGLIFAIILVVFFAISATQKKVANDAFFSIKLGEDIVKNGIRTDEFLTYHSTFSFFDVRWIFDIVFYLIYYNFNFLGTYIFIIFITIIISILLFYISYKKTNNIFQSLILTLLRISLLKPFLVTRAQTLSIIIFILQYYGSIELLRTNKTRYYVLLLVLPVLLVNIHGSVFPTMFIFYLPFVAEYLMSKSPVIVNKFQALEFSKDKRLRNLVIIAVISIFEGLISPFGVYPYYMMFATALNYSTLVIKEMSPLDINSIYLYFMIAYGVFFLLYPKKHKAHTAFLFFGISIMSVVNVRSFIYFFTICTLIISTYLKDFFDVCLSGNLKKFLVKNRKSIFLVCICICIVYSSCSFYNESISKYIPEENYPINAVKYMLNELDLSKEVLFNGFNTGSYLELNNIKTFMDSRAELYEKPFNDTYILRDYAYSCCSEKEDYKEFFEKYNFTLALIEKDSIIYERITKDNFLEKEKIIYEDDYFILYRLS